MGTLPPEIVNALMESINSALPDDWKVEALGNRILGIQTSAGSLTPVFSTVLTAVSHRAAVKYVSKTVLGALLFHLRESDRSPWPDPANGDPVPLAEWASISGDQLVLGYGRGDDWVLQFPAVTLPTGWY